VWGGHHTSGGRREGGSPRGAGWGGVGGGRGRKRPNPQQPTPHPTPPHQNNHKPPTTTPPPPQHPQHPTPHQQHPPNQPQPTPTPPYTHHQTTQQNTTPPHPKPHPTPNNPHPHPPPPPTNPHTHQTHREGPAKPHRATRPPPTATASPRAPDTRSGGVSEMSGAGGVSGAGRWLGERGALCVQGRRGRGLCAAPPSTSQGGSARRPLPATPPHHTRACFPCGAPQRPPGRHAPRPNPPPGVRTAGSRALMACRFILARRRTWPEPGGVGGGGSRRRGGRRCGGEWGGEARGWGGGHPTPTILRTHPRPPRPASATGNAEARPIRPQHGSSAAPSPDLMASPRQTRRQKAPTPTNPHQIHKPTPGGG